MWDLASSRRLQDGRVLDSDGAGEEWGEEERMGMVGV